jgi:hypothetical protein
MIQNLTNSSAAADLSEIPLYPILTREVGSNSSSGGQAGSTSGDASSLPGMAKNAIRSALGWQFRSGDATANLRSFESALGKAFRFREVEGHTEWAWVPQGFSIQADLGEITGAQASICRQAQALLDQTLPLLDKLEPLSVAADEQDVEAMRAIIRSELTEIVNELGLPGGPRVQKVDNYFWLLIGAVIKDDGDVVVDYDPRGSSDPEDDTFKGHLREFRDRLSMTENRINTVEEEVKFTDFLLLVDNVASLHRSWIDKRDAFATDGRLFFGTLLSRLGRLMEVIPLSIRDLCCSLDSVYVGAAERQVIELDAQDLVVVIDNTKPSSARLLKDADLAKLRDWAEKYKPTEKDLKDKEIKEALEALKEPYHRETGALEITRDAFIVLRCEWGEERFNTRVNGTTPALEGFTIKAIGVGAGIDSITLDGLLTWIEHFVTVEGRQLIDAGGKDGTMAFARTMQRFTDFVYAVLIYVADYANEIDGERSSGSVNTELIYYPGFHTARVYRALRQLFTHLQAAARLAGSEGAIYVAPVFVTEEDSTPELPPLPSPRKPDNSIPEPQVPLPPRRLPFDFEQRLPRFEPELLAALSANLQGIRIDLEKMNAEVIEIKKTVPDAKALSADISKIVGEKISPILTTLSDVGKQVGALSRQVDNPEKFLGQALKDPEVVRKLEKALKLPPKKA